MMGLLTQNNWTGAQVIIDESASSIGWVKEVKADKNNSNEIKVVVVPTRCRWLPNAVTGAYEFSINAVLVFGENCLIVANPVDLIYTPPNRYAGRAINPINKVLKAIVVLPIVPPLVFLFLPIFVVFSVYVGIAYVQKVIFKEWSSETPGLFNAKILG